MPRISKVRIVNFTYNDGKRLIADELFNFENSAKDDALNVLINLENGGGKSVLVQLMMQPVLPRAKVAGRKIESFFGSVRDHCYVVLEWLKDGSPEKLLTGISMAASQSAAAEDDVSRGRTIKYYTFYAEYKDDRSRYSIVNLPLSRKENGKFIPAAFEDIRNFAKKSSHALEYYATEDAILWKRKLEEYGIVQNEWRMIEALNSEEGGLTKYFGDFKTSDQLIEKLLVPTIERKQASGADEKEASLGRMLLSHVDRYLKNQKALDELKIYEAFELNLQQLNPQVTELWNANDLAEKALHELFGLSDALSHEISKLEQAKAESAKQMENLQQDKYKIQWEEVSAKYYECLDKAEAAEAACRLAQQGLNEKQEQLHSSEHAFKAMECAGYYQTACRLQGDITGLQKAIDLQEQGGDHAEELARLKYSAFCAVQKEQSLLIPLLEQLQEQSKQLAAESAALRKKHCEAQQRQEKVQSEYDRIDGNLQGYESETDDLVRSLSEPLQRRLDGAYETDELEALISDHSNQIEQQKKACAEAEAQITQREAEKEQLPQKIAEKNVQLQQEQERLQRLRDEYKAYQDEEEQIRPIFDEYSLSFSKRFDDYLIPTLHTMQNSNRADQMAAQRSIDLLKEELTAVERGSVHVPNAVIQYLESTGIRYNTCEKYLQELVKAGKLPLERCLEILKQCPAAAYGILVQTEGDALRLQQQEHEQWLPALVPILCPEQMERVLNEEEHFAGAIAFYSKEYFKDWTHYRNKLEQRQEQQKHTLEQLRLRADRLEQQLRTAEKFTYTADWGKQQNRKITASTDACERIEDEIKILTAQQATLKQQITEWKARKSVTEQTLDTLRHTEEKLQQICLRIQKEEELRQKKYQQQELLLDAKQEVEQVGRALAQRQEKLQNLCSQLQDKQSLQRSLQDALEILGECRETTIYDGNWQGLLEQYQQLQQSASRELQDLQERLAEKQRDLRQQNAEIAKREIAKEDYCDIQYSMEKECALAERQKSCQAEENNEAQAYQKVVVAAARTEAFLKQAEDALEPFGEALEKAQIGTDFKNRMQVIEHAEKELTEILHVQEKRKTELNRIVDRLTSKLENYAYPENVPVVTLEENSSNQMDRLCAAWKKQTDALKAARSAVQTTLTAMEKKFPEENKGPADAISAMCSIFSGNCPGDSYFTLSMQVEAIIVKTNLEIERIRTDLSDFKYHQDDLVHQCVLQGQRIYEGLLQMQRSSQVIVYPGKPKKEIIRFGVPAEVDVVLAEDSIRKEIDTGVRELLQDRQNNATQELMHKHAAQIVGSVSLLHKYIRQDSIGAEAYKIDRNPQNSRYRSWRDTQINNSGAEKFVVYFAVILTLINYARGDLSAINSKEKNSALILDNPFGATSSVHILKPMFEIARHFHVQLICLSHINKADVINCFDIVIQAVLKKRPLSSNELLTHEGDEQIEHGFYRSEQLSWLN